MFALFAAMIMANRNYMLFFSNSPTNEKPKNKNKPFDPYNWDNPDNCSDREYIWMMISISNIYLYGNDC